MNKNRPDQYQQHDYGYHTHRSERYRHPEQHLSKRRSENYGSSGYGGYSNEHSYGSFNDNRDQISDSRNVSNQDIYGTYSTSRNYGNMGSYGGAQGYGSSRAGYSSQRRHDDDDNHSFDSGHGSRYDYDGPNRGYRGYQEDIDSYDNRRDAFESRNRGWSNDREGWNSNRDRNSSNRNWDNDQNSGLYGTYSSRRYEGNRQDRHNNDDRYRPQPYTNDLRDRHVYRGDYSSFDGNFGSLRSDDNDAFDRDEHIPYGVRSFYYGGYGSSR